MTRIAVPFALLAIGCAPSAAVYACPQLVVDDYEWIGAVGPPGTAAAFERVTLQVEDQVLDVASAGADGSFALRGYHRGAFRRGVRPEIHAGGHTIARIEAGPASASIAYAPGARPVVEDAPMVRFTGELQGATSHPPAIRETYVVNWGTHGAAPARARVDEEFSAAIAGHAGDCISVLSVHEDGTTGGCWWPGGGGCICHHCSLEAELADSCIDSTDPNHLYPPTLHTCTPVPGEILTTDVASGEPGATHGRTPLPADERTDPGASSSGPPPPDRGGEIPTGHPSSPSDAGAPDAGPPPHHDPDADAGAPS
jgi:hypothetical protein